MKLTRTLLLCLLVVLTVPALTFTQATPNITLSVEHLTKEKSKRPWSVSGEFNFTNKVESENKVSIIDSPTTLYTARFDYSTARRQLTMETTTGFTARKIYEDKYLRFRAKATQRFANKLNFSGDTEIVFTRWHNFGKIGAEASTDIAGERNRLRPFTRIDYYFPLGNSLSNYSRANSGISWSSGLQSEFEVKSFIFDNKSQVIYDSGAIFSGQRTLFGTSSNIGYKLNRICFGPTFGYTRLLRGEFHQKNSFFGGMFVRYR